MNKPYELQHFREPQFSPSAEGWTHIEFGHNDVRCTGGSWWYKGDKALALVELTKRKAEHAKASNAYYAQPWV
jgi:hypothetical protein